MSTRPWRAPDRRPETLTWRARVMAARAPGRTATRSLSTGPGTPAARAAATAGAATAAELRAVALEAAVAVFGTVNVTVAVTAGGVAVTNTAPAAAGSVTLVRGVPVRSRDPAGSATVRVGAPGSLTSATPRSKSRRMTPPERYLAPSGAPRSTS